MYISGSYSFMLINYCRQIGFQELPKESKIRNDIPELDIKQQPN